MLGCVGAGKTALMRELEASCSGRRLPPAREPQPTVGTELLDLKHARCTLAVREVGGAMLPLWGRFFEACRTVIFVADTSSAEALGSAVVEWYNLLCAELLAGKPMLLVLNQRDREEALAEEAVRHMFRLADLEASGRTFAICWTSAASSAGIDKVLEWCITAHST